MKSTGVFAADACVRTGAFAVWTLAAARGASAAGSATDCETFTEPVPVAVTVVAMFDTAGTLIVAGADGLSVVPFAAATNGDAVPPPQAETPIESSAQSAKRRCFKMYQASGSSRQHERGAPHHTRNQRRDRMLNADLSHQEAHRER
jgi:hypothetical protein